MKKRLFLAVEIPENIKKKIVLMQKELKNAGILARWVNPENLHLTLIFLGEADYSEIPNIINLTEASRMPEFKVECLSLGGFPKIQNPHTLWIGIEKSKNLAKLQKRLAKNFLKAGHTLDEKNFQPHLTIARFGRKIFLERKINLKKYHTFKFGIIPVSEIILFESELSDEGPKHIPIRKIRLS